MDFVGREPILSDIEERLASAPGSRSCVVVLAAAPGVGKTQLASHYASTHRETFDLVWWIRGATPTTIAASLAELVGAAEGPYPDGSKRPILHRAVEIISRSSRPLLVVDDADDPGVVAELIASTRASFLITTRTDRWPASQSIRVEPFSTADAIQAASRMLASVATPEVTEELVHELGLLPWSIAAAAKYCNERGVTAERYLELNRGRPEKSPENKALALILEGVEAKAPAADSLLTLLSALAPSVFPLALLRKHAEVLPKSLAHATLDQTWLDSSCADLLRWHLITRQDEIAAIHRFVQLGVRRRLSHSRRADGVLAAARLLSASLPPVRGEETALGWARAIPHAIEVVDQARSTGVTSFPIAYLASGIGQSLLFFGDSDAGLRWQEVALDILDRTEGSSEVATALQLHQTARMLLDTGNRDVGKRMLRRAIAMHEQLAGRDCVATAFCYRTLAGVHLDEGEPDQACEILGYNLDFLEGLKSPDAISEALHTHELMGIAEVNRGNSHDGLDHLLRVLKHGWPRDKEGCIRMANSMSAAGAVFFGASEFELATGLLEVSKKAFEDLGETTTSLYATVLHNLAATRAQRDRHAEAIALARASLLIRGDCLPPAHPDIAQSWNALGAILSEAGSPRKALPFLTQACRYYARQGQFGSPHMRRALWNLAAALDGLTETDGAFLCLRSAIRSAELEANPQATFDAYQMILEYAERVRNIAVMQGTRDLLREMRASTERDTILDPNAVSDRSESSEQAATDIVDSDPERLWRRGVAAMHSQEWPTASDAFRQLLGRAGVPVTVELNLATAEARSGRFDSAMKHADSARKKLPADSEALTIYGSIACTCGEFSKALEALDPLPDSQKKDLVTAVAQSGLDRFNELLETIARVRRRGYNDNYLTLRAGHANLAIGRPREAVCEFDRVIEDEGARRHGGERSSEELDEALYCKAIALLQIQAEAPSDDLLRESAVALRAYIMSTEDSEFDYQQILQTLQELEPERARDYVEMVLEQTKDIRLEMLRLQVLAALGQFDDFHQASVALSGSDDLPPYAIRDVAVLRAGCLLRLERFEEVLSFVEGKGGSPIPPGIRGNFRGAALLALDEHQEARKAFAEALGSRPEDPVILTNLARVEHELGERESGIGHAEQALVQDPSFVQAWLLLNEILLSDSQPEKAAQLRMAATRIGLDLWEADPD